MKIISIDPSLYSTGIYLSEFQKSMTLKVEKSLSYWERLNVLFGMVSAMRLDISFDLCLMEDYAFSPVNKKGLNSLVEACGIIKYAVGDIPIINVPISTWKKVIGLPWLKKIKKTTKEYVEKASEQFGRKFETSDEADAYMIYRACYMIHGAEEGLLSPGAVKVKKALDSVNKCF